MKYILAASALTLVSTQSLAADHTQYYQPPETVFTAPEYDWSGFYIGIHGGYGWSSSQYDHVETVVVGGAELNREPFSVDPSNWSGGFQAGYQQQMDQFVLGAEVAYQFFRADDYASTNLGGTPRTRESEIHDLLTVSAKGGFAWERMLAYAKGGYATTELNYNNRLISNGDLVGYSKDRLHGFTLGAGIDYAVTDNWILGAEYSFHRFSIDDQQQLLNGVPVAAFNDHNRLTSHNLALRLNYKF